MILNKDNIVEYCRNWFNSTGKPIPKTAREWKYTGKDIPPGTSATILRSIGLKPSELINLLHGYVVSSTNRSHNLEETLMDVGLSLLKKHYTPDGKYTVEYSCKACGHVDITDQSTLIRWKDKKCYGCPTCRGSSGKQKPLDYYQEKVPGFIILDRPDTRHFLLKCSVCCQEFTRALVSILDNYKRGTKIQCPHCSVSNTFIKGRTDGWDSEIERACITRLQELIPNTQVERQVYYKSITSTTTNHTADAYIKQYNCIIEVTSKSNNIPNYEETLLFKKQLAESSGLLWFVARSVSEIDDIVQSLLKGKE